MKILSQKIKNVLLLIIATSTSFGSFSQCGPLSTPIVTNNGQSGIMFDVAALLSVNITQLGMDYDNGTYNLEIYGKAGTHVGSETNAAAWTLLGTVNGWNGIGGTIVPIPVYFSQFLCAGDVGAFYITASNSTSGNYSNGTGVGVVAAADANIQIKQGTGKAHPFGASFTPRVPNVTAFYTCAISCCLPPTMAMTQEICSGACDGSATATVGLGGVPPYSFQWDAAAGNQTTQTATGLCAGTYSVDVTDGSGCVSSGTVIVTSGMAGANATITPVGPYCPLDPPLNLVGADPGGTWTGNGITNSVLGTFDPATAGVGTHTITYTIATPCGDVQTYDIVVNGNLDATINPIGAVCALAPAFLLTAVDAGGAWSGTGITNASTGQFTPSVAGAGTFTITYTISGSCGDLQTYDITVDPALDATITQVGPFCTAEPQLNLSAVDPGGTWSGNGITNVVTGTFDPATAGIGTHTIAYSIPGACGDNQTIDIIINPLLDATINPVGAICELDAPFILTAVDSGGNWSGTGITNAATGEFDPGVAGSGMVTISYTISGVCGSVGTYDFNIDPALDATITQVGPFCDIDPIVTLAAVDAGGFWSGTGITNGSTGEFNPSVAGNGIHTITYLIPGACGDAQTIDISVVSNSNATITGAGPFCLDAPSTTLTAVDPGGTWSGNGITNPATGSFDPFTAGVGTHTITYTITGNCGDIQTSDIIVNSLDDATITPSGPYCLGSTATLSAVTGGGTWSGPGITNGATGDFNATIAGTGIHTITYTTLGPCPDVETTIIEVYPPLTVQAFGGTSICDGSQVTLTTSGSGGNGNITFVWTDQNASLIGTGTSVNVTPSANTTYTVTIADDCGTPIQMANVVVVVYAIPTVSFFADNLLGCVPLDVNFANTSFPNGTTCSWNLGNGMTSSNTGFASTQYTNPGCYDITLTVTQNGCTNSLTLDDYVCVADQPEADFSFSPDDATIFDPEFEFTNLSSYSDSYLWNFGDGTSSTQADPSFIYPQEPGGHMVCLVASNTYGCYDTICKPVTIVEDVIFYIPNSFTPDGDEFNQSFNPIFTTGIDEFDYNFLIFNRWGELIWESNNPNVGWDGTFGKNQKLVESGTYVWRVEYKVRVNNERREHNGVVNVLR